VLQRLEAMAYIERVVDPKDSSRLILLTAKGRSLWDTNMRPVIADYYREALAGFSTEDKIHLVHYLDKMLRNFKIDPDPWRKVGAARARRDATPHISRSRAAVARALAMMICWIWVVPS
jgi:hypothetical protein